MSERIHALSRQRKELIEQRKTEHGFTLLELLVVIAIIGILIALIIPAVFSIQNNAKVNAAKADAHSLQAALDEYKLQYTGYPGDPSLASMTPLPPGATMGSTTDYTTFTAALSPGFINLPAQADANFVLAKPGGYTGACTSQGYTPPAAAGGSYKLTIFAKDNTGHAYLVQPTGISDCTS